MAQNTDGGAESPRGARRRASSEPPPEQLPDILPGGGFQGLTVRLNIVHEGLQRTQQFLGGVVMEAEETLGVICSREEIFHCRLERIENMLNISYSPPATPKGDGAQSPRCQEAEKIIADESAANVPGEGAALGMPEPSSPEPRSSSVRAYNMHENGDETAADPTRKPGNQSTGLEGKVGACGTTSCSTSLANSSAASNSAPRSVSPDSNCMPVDPIEGMEACLRSRLEQTLDETRQCESPSGASMQGLAEMIQECVQHTIFDKLESQVAHVEDALRGDLANNLRTGLQLCSQNLMAQLNDCLQEQLAELKVPAGATEELEQITRRLTVQDTALSGLEARVQALRKDMDTKMAELTASQRTLEAATSHAVASAASSFPQRGARKSCATDADAGGAEAGLAQGVTALARMFGLMRKGEILGSGDWAWDRCRVGQRLEQAWNLRAMELGVPPNAVGRFDLFDLLREGQRPSAGAAISQAADADQREASRLKAWLQNSQHQRPQSATREKNAGPQAPLSATEPAPNRAASWASFEQAASSDKAFSQTHSGSHGFGEEVRCGSGFRGVATNRRSPSAHKDLGSRPPRP